MSTQGFRWKRSLGGTRDIRRTPHASGNKDGFHGGLPGAVSKTFYNGDPLKFSNGKLTTAGTTDTVEYVCDAPVGSPITTASTDETCIPVIKVDGQLFEAQFTPLVAAGSANSNATTTTVKTALTDGSSSDLVGGLVYCHELDEVRVITANTYSSNVVTITVAKGFSRAVTTGDTVSIVPFGYGNKAVRMTGSAGSLAIDTAIASATGGKVAMYSINMKKKTAEVFFV